MLVLIAPLARSLSGFEDMLIQILAVGLALNLLALGAEFNSQRSTEDAEAAAAFILTGRYRAHFWLGVFILGNLVPVLFLTQGWAIPAAMLALFGLGVFDEIFVRAGQSIPLS